MLGLKAFLFAWIISQISLVRLYIKRFGKQLQVYATLVKREAGSCFLNICCVEISPTSMFQFVMALDDSLAATCGPSPPWPSRASISYLKKVAPPPTVACGDFRVRRWIPLPTRIHGLVSLILIVICRVFIKHLSGLVRHSNICVKSKKML